MKAGPEPSGFSEINVTPLVDVMLVLLIIFMVAAPMLQPGISVKLPHAQTAKPVESQGLTITLSKEDVAYVDGRAISLRDLRSQLAPRRGEGSIVIRADRYASVGHLMELWDLCRDLGFSQIHIATAPDEL